MTARTHLRRLIDAGLTDDQIGTVLDMNLTQARRALRDASLPLDGDRYERPQQIAEWPAWARFNISAEGRAILKAECELLRGS